MRKIIFALLILFSSHTHAKTIYVNINAIGLNNGTSWVNAFIRIDSAMINATKGDTIKVAAGIYKPTNNSDVTISFSLTNGVIFLGGYPNTGNPSDAQRNWSNHPTILSGRLALGYTSESILKIQSLDTSTVLDGFYISGGNGNGAGINIKNSTTLIIRNTIFEKNQFRVIYIENSTTIFINCILNKNDYFTTCIYNLKNSTSTFYNCIITGNAADEMDFRPIILNEDAWLNITNCDIVNNKGSLIFSKGIGNITLKNSIIWNNRNQYGAYEDNDAKLSMPSVIIDHCITQTFYNYTITTLLTHTDPRFLDIKNPAGSDDKFFTYDDGLQLMAPCSPGLNYGDNGAVNNLNFDILGNPRIYNNGIVDLGPYERQTNIGIPFKTVYVNSNITNTVNNDGSSWQKAFKTLQEAFFYCADTIKVSEGTYFTTNSNSDSVFMLENGKVIMGGYPPTGNPTDAERNPDLYHTLLKNANYNYGNYYSVNQVILKSYHNDSTTVIDGVEFNNDKQNNRPLYISYGSKLKVLNCKFLSTNDELTGNGIFISKSSSPFINKSVFDTHASLEDEGAVVCTDNSSPKITKCIFKGVTAFQQRTGFAAKFINSTGLIDSCTFLRNSPLTQKSVIYIDNSNTTIKNCVFRSIATGKNVLTITNNSSPSIENCEFKNIARSTAYAIAIENSSPAFNKCLFDSTEYYIRNTNRSVPVFNNCVSINGMFMKNTNSFPVMKNCTIVNTSTYTSAKALVINEDSSILKANNTIFWSDKLNAGETDIYNANLANNPTRNSNSFLTNCITQNYGTHGLNGNLVGENPRFFQFTNIYGPDNKMFTPDDGIRLAKCSPAINAGNNSLGTVLTRDVLDNSRVTNSTIDIGAYELQETPGSVNLYYVNAKASGSNTGESWQDAYTNLQNAICNACADTIKVAEGIYKPATLARDSSFFINRPISLYGGFPSFGNPSDNERDVFAYPTILSGNIGNKGDSTDNSNSVIVITGIKDSAVIDGFEVRDSYMNGGTTYNALGGGGICTYYNHTNITNCRFLNNVANPKGGAISIGSLASSRISKCIFINNFAQNEGGALFFSGTSMEVSGCAFENNYSINGGAIGLASKAIIYNSVFYRNYVIYTGRGGAIFSSTFGKIFNCTFLENRTTKPDLLSGGAVWGNNNVLTTNCIFKGNKLGNSTTTMGADLDWNGNYSYVSNCLLQTKRQYSNANIYEVDPNFINSASPKGADGKWLTEDDGVQLDFNSPGIDYGDNVIINNVPFDIIGNDRLQNNKVDAGAYEFQNRPIANAGSDTTICSGSTIKIGTRANPNHIYRWTSNPAGFVSTDSVPSVTPADITSYYLEVSNGSITAKDTITVTISDSLVPSVSIATLSTNICENTLASFTAKPIYAGDSAIYQWQVDGLNVGANANVFTASSLINASQVKVILTSSASCASKKNSESNILQMTVNPVVIPSVTITPTDTTICSGNTLTLTASVENGGATPSYQWQRNGFNIGTNSNVFTQAGITSGAQFRVILSGSAACSVPHTDTSNIVVVKINEPVNPFVTIASSTTSICSGESVTFTATSVNGGSSPVYQWLLNEVNVGTNNKVYSTNNLKNNDRVKVILTSNESCITSSTVFSNAITATVTNKVKTTGFATSPAKACINKSFSVDFIGVNAPVDANVQLWESLNGGNYILVESKFFKGTLLNFKIENNTSLAIKKYFFSITLPGSTSKCNETANTDTTTTIVEQLTAPIIESANHLIQITNPDAGTTYKWQLQNNGMWNDMVPIATGRTYNAIISGTYRAKAELSGCIEYSNPLSIKVEDSVFGNEAKNIYLYPNPTTGFLTIDSLNINDNWVTLDIISAEAGSKVARYNISNKTTITLHLENIASGVYLAVFIRRDGILYYKKFIKI